MVRYFLERSFFTNMLSVFLMIAGVVVIYSMRRDAFPPVDFDIVYFTTTFSGASSEEVEKLVTAPIEREFKKVDGIKEMGSVSMENISYIFLTIDPDVKDKASVITNLRQAVDKVDLPDDVDRPYSDEVKSEEAPILQLAISSPDDYSQLRLWAKRLRDRLEDLPGVAQVEERGYHKEEVQVLVNNRSLLEQDLSVNEVQTAVRQADLRLPGGTYKQNNEEWTIATKYDLESIEGVENVVVRSNDLGRLVRIKDIAKVQRGYEDPDRQFRALGQPAIGLTIVKNGSADTIKVIEDVLRNMEAFRAELPDGYALTHFDDMSYYVKRRLKVLISNGILGFILVVVSLMLFLNLKIALVTAVGIPIAFVSALMVLNVMGVSINLISMLGLIIVLGMLVDDAIIIAENIYRHMEEGLSAFQAALQGTQEVVKPVIATVLTTIAAFSPLMLMEGIMGKFLWSIPLVVIICLIASVFEAFFILPAHVADFAAPSQTADSTGSLSRERWYSPLFKAYGRFITVVIRRRYLALFIFVLVLAGSLLLARYKMQFVLFPPDAVEVFLVQIEAPTGSSLDTTAKYIAPLEQEVMTLPSAELDTVVSEIGVVRNDPDDPMAKRGPRYGQVLVYLTPELTRERTTVEVKEDIRARIIDKKLLPENVKLTVTNVNVGPPVGKAVALEVHGNDFDNMAQVGNEAARILASIPGVSDINIDLERGRNERSLTVDLEKTAQLFLTPSQVSIAVFTTFEGAVVASFPRGDEEVDIRVRMDHEDFTLNQLLTETTVINSRGRRVPLRQLVKPTVQKGISAIRHKEGRRVVTISADIDTDINSSVAVNNDLHDQLKPFLQQYPHIDIALGGEFKDTQESLDSLFSAFGIAVLLILLILITTFHSFLMPLTIMLTLPFAAISIVLTFYVHSMPLSFMSLMGGIALCGVVVNDAIVMASFAVQLMRNGVASHDAITQACGMRLRQVLLTSITTCVGLFPTMYGLGGFDPFVQPMVLAMGWGLALASGITLVVLPCGMAIKEDIYPTKRLPTPETTELKAIA